MASCDLVHGAERHLHPAAAERRVDPSAWEPPAEARQQCLNRRLNGGVSCVGSEAAADASGSLTDIALVISST